MSPQSSRIHAGGVTLDVIDRGSGAPVVLLHGFPDSHALWRNQIPALAGAGFRVIAPSLRGFGESDRPEGTEAYGLAQMAGDVLALLDELRVGGVQIVGHDWGAALAWALAALAGPRVERLAALSVGHPNGYFATPRQRELSWYMLWFQFPGVAEELLPADDWRRFRQWCDSPDIDRYVADLSRPGALTAALEVYRANINPRSFVSGDQPLPRVACPVLGVWSTGDRFCGEDQLRDSGRFVDGPWRYERVQGGHWIPLDATDRLNELLLGFLEPGG